MFHWYTQLSLKSVLFTFQFCRCNPNVKKIYIWKKKLKKKITPMVYIYPSVFSVNIPPYLIKCWIRLSVLFSDIGFCIVSDDVITGSKRKCGRTDFTLVQTSYTIKFPVFQHSATADSLLTFKTWAVCESWDYTSLWLQEVQVVKIKIK